MIGYHLLTDGRSNTRTRIPIFTVQALKYLNDAIGVLLLETDAVIAYPNLVMARSLPARLHPGGQLVGQSGS